MKVELELPASLVKFYEAYARAFKLTPNESMRMVLSDFAFGAIDLGFSGTDPEIARKGIAREDTADDRNAKSR
ncbi:MAG: hypothetical protein JRN54_04865 [Nitrososphaerota archaeon]|jgi:hypothetical protein|nr:hypothetical protein [Nitrososphaerota archaeon]